MTLPPPRDHRISREDAATFTRRYRDNKGPGAVLAGMFHAEAVNDLLGQPGCRGLRIYYAQNADGAPALVLVGVDSNGNDLTEGILLEFDFPCPPFCGSSNFLNS